MHIDDDNVTVEQRPIEGSTVHQVTLTRPSKLNALPLSSVRALTESIELVEREKTAAVVLRGEGADFCAGMDLADMPDGDAVKTGGEVMHDVVAALRSCPVPVVTAAQGRAFGAGFMFCLGADIVVAAEDTTLGLQEVNLGIPIAGYVTTLLPRSVGEHRARDWLFTGRDVAAQEAARAGLIARVVPSERLDEVVADVVAAFETSSHDTIALLKDRMAPPTPAGDEGAWARLREREITDMREAAATGDLEHRLASFRDQ